MKYLITGISGFAGPNLAKLLLKQGHQVHGVIRCPNGRQADILDILSLQQYDKIKFHCLDLKQYNAVRKIFQEQSFDGVFHLAAQSHPPTSFKDPILTFQQNVMGSVNIITVLQKYPNTKMMFCSTSQVYGNSCKENGILKVTDALVPSNPYGRSKTAIDIYMQQRMHNGFLKGFVTRAFSHTGPRRGFNFSISSDAFQIAKMMLGKQQKVLKIGNLQTERVVIDVRDCVNAYYLLMKNDRSNGKVFNVCGSVIHKMKHYTQMLIKISGLEDVKMQIQPKFYRKIDIAVQRGDCEDLKELTGWQPTISLQDTMKDLLFYWVKKLGGK